MRIGGPPQAARCGAAASRRRPCAGAPGRAPGGRGRDGRRHDVASV